MERGSMHLYILPAPVTEAPEGSDIPPYGAGSWKGPHQIQENRAPGGEQQDGSVETLLEETDRGDKVHNVVFTMSDEEDGESADELEVVKDDGAIHRPWAGNGEASGNRAVVQHGGDGRRRGAPIKPNVLALFLC